MPALDLNAQPDDGDSENMSWHEPLETSSRRERNEMRGYAANPQLREQYNENLRRKRVEAAIARAKRRRRAAVGYDWLGNEKRGRFQDASTVSSESTWETDV